jgi:drug/metabolite transporter (DMT)-like permease
MNILAAILCIVLFSLTVPLTRMAALETTAESIIFMRLLGASVICIIAAILDGWIPPKSSWKGILFTAMGSVIGFASMTAFAMREVPAAHGAVALAALPIVTATYSVLRDRLKPGKKFWFFALLGTLLSFGYFLTTKITQAHTGDLYLLLAVVCASFGYVEGGRLSRIHGGRRVMTWAVIVTIPIILPLAILYSSQPSFVFTNFTMKTWLSLFYLALISQSLGMFLWFRVLAKGPMEKIALVQLLQPFFTLMGSIVLLSETVAWSTWLIAFIVGLCILGANKEKASLNHRYQEAS